MSPAKDLGTKYTCFKCESKFYDLRKPAPICPKCGADQRESPALKPAPARKPSKAKAREVVPEVVPEAEDEELPAEEDADADAELGDEDDDV